MRGDASPTSGDTLRIELLGGFRVAVGERVVAPGAWRLRKARALVKLLALAPGHRLHREQVWDLLWPDLPPEAAANNLHQILYVARRVLGSAGAAAASYLELQGDVLALCPNGSLSTDVEAFEAAAATTRGSADPAAYRAAVTLYGGDLLPDDPYEDWAAGRRESLRGLYLALGMELAHLEERRGEVRAASEALDRLVASEPTHEEAHVRLMRLYARTGQRHQALRQYERLREALRRELDAEPQAATQRLYQRILAGEYPAASPRRPPPASPEVSASPPAPPAPAPALSPPGGRAAEASAVDAHGAGSGAPLLPGGPPGAASEGAPASAFLPPARPAGSGSEGERRQLTVLVARLSDALGLSADRDPEAAHQLVAPALERLTEAVRRYEGTVSQVTGEGVVALFGAPRAQEAHAVHACYAALRMQEAVQRYAAERGQSAEAAVQVQVGVDAGEVVLGALGNAPASEQTVVGATASVAARLAELAAPGTVVLAPNVVRLVEGYVQVKALGPTRIDGRSEPLIVHEALGAGAPRTRLQVSTGRGLTRFVGREAELTQLQQSLERVGAGRGQVVALLGEPGMGKSRLVWELTRAPGTAGWRVLETGAVAYGQATPYLPVVELLKGYCGIEARDGEETIRAKVTGQLLGLDPALASCLPALLALLDVPVEEPAWQALDPAERRQHTLDALRRLLLRESQDQPVLLVVEDLHWIDSETQALLDRLVESLPTARLLLLVTYRPGYRHPWGEKTYYTQLHLDSLLAASARELLRALLGDEAGLEPLKARLIEQTDGNPFFLEESIRTLVETQALEGTPGAYRPARSVGSLPLPASVQAVLAARIDRLAPEDKRLLQTAAVIGKDVPYPFLQAIADLPEQALRGGLARLQAAEFLYETALFPELEYTFKHALTHDVAYGSVLQERRRALHGRIAAAIEARYPERLTEHVEQLAHHTLRAEAWEHAVPYLQQAGAKAAGRSALREARGYYEQAIAALEHLPTTRARQIQAIDLRLALRNVLLPLIEFSEIIQRLQQAEALALAVDDQRRLGRVLVFQSTLFWQTGAARAGIEAGLRARAVAEALDDFGLQVAADWALGPAYYHAGDFPAANRVFRQMIDALQGDDQYADFGLTWLPAVHARGFLATSLAALGAFAEAHAVGEEGLRIAEAADHPYSIAGVTFQRGVAYCDQGNLPMAIDCLEQAIALSQQRQLLAWSATARSTLAYAYLLAGRVEEGQALLPNLDSTFGRYFRVGYWLPDALRLAGRLAEAAGRATEELTTSREHGARIREAWALRSLGDLAAHGPAPAVDDAERYYQEARALATELGMRPLAAHCHLGLGTLFQRVGRGAEALAELTTAAEMYRAMQMIFWLTRAKTALATV